MILSHKIRLYPKPKQVTDLNKACGVARYTWNWALNAWNIQYASGMKPNALALKKQWNSQKPNWVYESPKDANQQPFTHLSKAWSSFFKKKSHRPTFKKKGMHDSFYLSNDKFHVENKYVRIPRIGTIKMAETVRFEGKIMSATVSRDAHTWNISLSVDVGENFHYNRTGNTIVGVDLGVSSAAALSTGEKLTGPKPLKKFLDLLRRRSRQHSRKKKGSANRRKSAMRLTRLHRKIKCQRNDFLHKLTTRLCRENQAVAVEDLNVKGLMANHNLARAISDIGMYEFRRQLEYKSGLFKNQIVIASRWFPSTKMCNSCGLINDIPLSQRTYTCECGYVEDRDVNAAKNLRDYTRGYRGMNACGHGGSGLMEASSETAVVEAGISVCAHKGSHRK